MVFLAIFHRNIVSKSFGIRGIGLVKIHVDGFLGAGTEGDTKIVGGVNVVLGIQCHFHVAVCRMHEI